VIFTPTRPFKRHVHNNYLSFPTIDGGDGFERPKSPISQHLDALEVQTQPIHGRAQFYCGLGGHARAQHGHILSAERRRRRHPAQNMFWPNPRRKNREGTSIHNSPAKRRRCCDFMLHVPIQGHFCVLRSRLLVITDFKRAVRAYQACWRWPGQLIRPFGG
jgi:hypothetical protein